MTHFDVIIPTTLRLQTLDLCLAQLQRAKAPEHSSVSILVVVNGHENDRRANKNESKNRFPVKWDCCSNLGKNAALNFGISRTDGELIVCLDDDVLVDQHYFCALEEGLRTWPHASIFGGRVIPEWPDCYPGELDDNIIRYSGFAFGQTDPQITAGPTVHFSPVENNMILVRCNLPSKYTFNPAIGPRSGTYTMGSGEELFRTIRNGGGEIVYLPNALVKHIVRSEQMTIQWLLRRSVYWGMSVAHFQNRHHDIQGNANPVVLFLKLVQRSLRLFRMCLKSERYPLVWARIDLNVLRGICRARISSSFNKIVRVKQTSSSK